MFSLYDRVVKHDLVGVVTIRRFFEHMHVVGELRQFFMLSFDDGKLNFFFFVLLAKGQADVIEAKVLLFNFLVMRSTLICSPSTNEIGHGFKDFIHTPHFFIEEVLLVFIEENKILPLFILCPVADVHPL